MNLNFIELLTIILLLIAIRNSSEASDGNNIKPQAIKRLVKQDYFLHSTYNFIFGL